MKAYKLHKITVAISHSHDEARFYVRNVSCAVGDFVQHLGLPFHTEMSLIVNLAHLFAYCVKKVRVLAVLVKMHPAQWMSLANK